MAKTAGVVIIGNEVLNGNVVDANSPFLCKRLRSLGINVSKISTILDEVNLIAEEVKLFSQAFDIVITTGGIGPTHDDVTYEGVAAAFEVGLEVNKKFRNFYQSYLESGDPFSARMVTIPVSAEVIIAHLKEPLEGQSYFPVAKVRNVFVFPGIPEYLRRIFIPLEKKYFQNSNVLFFSRVIHLVVDEINVVPVLNEVVARYENSVTFGSYPLVGSSRVEDAVAKITMESISLTECLNAEISLLSRIPSHWITFPKQPAPCFDFIERLATFSLELSKKLKTSFQIIAECFSKYNVSETFISFNGGKDCTVLLHLVYGFCTTNRVRMPLTLVYFKESDSFLEVDSFIEDIGNKYCVDVRTLPAPMKSSLVDFMKKESKMKACFLGLRQTDPKTGNLKPMQVKHETVIYSKRIRRKRSTTDKEKDVFRDHTRVPSSIENETDSDWPKLMRCSPILHWSYKDVWDFIRCANIPYCSLYNRGYTSLGSKSNTSVNPALKIVNENGSICYKPAFLLDENNGERDGRCTKEIIKIDVSRY